MTAVHSQHPLFRRFPLVSTRTISVGSVPIPYHIYDGHTLLIGGTADLAAAMMLLASEDLRPIQTAAGKALMAIWVCDFTHASLEPHTELQFSLFVSRHATTATTDHPLALLEVFSKHPDATMLCHGLWNNNAQVVAYNREILSLDARLSTSSIARTASGVKFTYTDSVSAEPLITGEVTLRKMTAGSVNWSILRLLGLSAALQAGSAPWLTLQVTNPKGVLLPHHADAQAYAAGKPMVIKLFDPQTDSLTVQHPAYAALNFQPTFAQHLDNIKFVYLNPHNAGEATYHA